jgi:membrane protein
MTSTRGLADTGSRTARALARRPLVALVLRSLQRYIAIDGTQRGLVLAGQAFSALIPLLIVLATLVSSNGGARLAARINARFRLTGNGADAVRTLFTQPPGAVQSVTIGSVLLLIVSGLSCARTMQRSYEAAWQLPPRGLRGTIGGAGALALLLTQILLLSLLAGFLRQAPAGSVLEFAARVVASSALWLALQHLLLGGRVAWRRLLPGAIAAGAGQQGVAALSTLWIPGVIENNATRYGAIGVSFALLSWLVLISIVLVVAAAVSVELGHGPPLPAPGPGQRRGLVGTLARLLGADDMPAEVPAKSPAESPAGRRTDLVVLGFPTRPEAEAVLAAPDPEGRELLDLQDAALAWRTPDGTITVQQAYGATAGGGTGGTVWGPLLGLLFRMPVFGLTAGAAGGDRGSRLTDLGIDDAFMNEVAARLTPGSAAVFALAHRGTTDSVRAAVLPHHPAIIRTSLSVGEESELVRRLQEAQPEPPIHAG